MSGLVFLVSGLWIPFAFDKAGWMSALPVLGGGGKMDPGCPVSLEPGPPIQDPCSWSLEPGSLILDLVG